MYCLTVVSPCKQYRVGIQDPPSDAMSQHVCPVLTRAPPPAPRSIRPEHTFVRIRLRASLSLFRMRQACFRSH